MSAWAPDELDRITAAEELGVAPARPDGTLRRTITIWVVRQGDELNIRSSPPLAGGLVGPLRRARR